MELRLCVEPHGAGIGVRVGGARAEARFYLPLARVSHQCTGERVVPTYSCLQALETELSCCGGNVVWGSEPPLPR